MVIVPDHRRGLGPTEAAEILPMLPGVGNPGHMAEARHAVFEL